MSTLVPQEAVMLLSTSSWSVFWLFVVVAALAVMAIIIVIVHKLFGENAELGEILYIGLAVCGTVAIIISGVVLGFIIHGGHKAQSIHDDLTNQSYAVGNIDLSDNQAQIVIDGQLEWVMVIQNDQGTWQPYRSCAISTPQAC